MNVIMKTKNIPVDNAKVKNRHMVLIFFQTKKHYTKLKMKSRSNDFKLDTYQKKILLPKIMECNVPSEEENIIGNIRS